jgi:hypothetical protein
VVSRVAATAGPAVVAFALAACGADEPRSAANPTASDAPADAVQPPDPPPPTTETVLPGATEPGAETVIPSVDADQLEAVVRAWSEALNAGDNDAAAALFAPDAIVIQAGLALRLPDHAAAVSWNASLPCSGAISAIQVTDGFVVAVFVLGDRPTSTCDAAPGTLAAAAFLIENGKIAVWEQVPVPEDASPEQSAAPGEPPALTAAAASL